MKHTLMLAVILMGLSANARDNHIGLRLNTSVNEILTYPPIVHGGLYPSLGVSLLIPVNSYLTIIPTAGYQWSFDQNRGGYTLGVTFERHVGRYSAFDLIASLTHDFPFGKFSESALYLGAGAGMSFFIGRCTLSPSINVYTNLVNVTTYPSFSFGPGLSVGWTIL
jgi:hypothetical protein